MRLLLLMAGVVHAPGAWASVRYKTSTTKQLHTPLNRWVLPQKTLLQGAAAQTQ
jgi:hypothetical protein